jgi:hypothetical protein
MTLTITSRESPKEVVMRSNRIKMAAAGVVTAGSLVAGVGVAQANVPVPNSNPVVHPSSGLALTAEVLSDGSVLVQGTGFNPNVTLDVILDDGAGHGIINLPVTGANGNFVTEFKSPSTFIGCVPSGATVYAYNNPEGGGNNGVWSNRLPVPGAGCAVPPTGGGGGTGGTLWPHVHYQ